MNRNSIVQNTTQMCKNAYNFVFFLWEIKMSTKYTKILVSTQATILFESIVWWSSSYDLLNKIKRSLTSFLLAQISTERHHNFIFKVKTNGRSKNKENYTKCFKQTLKNPIFFLMHYWFASKLFFCQYFYIFSFLVPLLLRSSFSVIREHKKAKYEILYIGHLSGRFSPYMADVKLTPSYIIIIIGSICVTCNHFGISSRRNILN